MSGVVTNEIESSMMRLYLPRGYPLSPTARACDHAQARAHRAPIDAPPIEPPIINHRYERALAADRTKLTRTPTDTTRATCALSFDETCAIVETGQLVSRKNGRTYRETRRILIALAYARIRYGRTRNGAQRFRFYFRTSSQGHRALDSRTGAHVSLEVVHAELSRLGLDADAITAHLASVCAPAHTGTRKAREIATPYYPPPSLTQFHGERVHVKASDILEPIWRKRFAR